MDDPDEVNRLRIALARIARGIDRQVTGDGMTRTQLALLGTVARTGTIGVGRLAELEGINPTMLSRSLGKLETMGLVRRSADPDDRRAVVVEITAAGRRLFAKLRAQRTALFGGRLADLPKEHRAALLAAVPALESLGESLRADANAQALR